MRVAVGGIYHESNTFASGVTGLSAFEAGSLARGAELARAWQDAHHELGGFLEELERAGVEPVPTTMAWATPAGPVDDAVIDLVVEEIALGARGADGLLLSLHGAMVTRAHPGADCEALRRLRAAFGPEFPIAVTLDFHANCAQALADQAGIIVGYQTYPHLDQRARGLLAARLLLRALRGEVRPVAAIAKPPVLVNLLAQATDREPMRGLLASAREAERRAGMLSVSLLGGFPYADVPDMGPAVVALADGDRALARRTAGELAARVWEAREELCAGRPGPAEAVEAALAASRRPVVLADLGDNVGGGSAGDGTVLLAELLARGARSWSVVLCDPGAAAAARAAGAGARFDGEVGGKTDRLHGPPVRLRGRVRSLHHGRWIETEPRHGGRRENDQGPTAVIEVEGGGPAGRLVVLDSLRTPPFSLGQLTSLGIDPHALEVIVVKAAVAHRAAYDPIAALTIEVDTPGLTAINPTRFTYRRIRRPMYPLERW